MDTTNDTWNSGDPYEYFMGRWSTLIAPVFLNWLKLPDHLSWLDLGCGTGALSEAIYLQCKPASLSAIDPSPAFIEKARARLPGTTDLVTGNASHIPVAADTFDVVVSGLALNFFEDLSHSLTEIKRVLKTNGIMAAYVWDYSGRMDFLRLFWDAACELNEDAKQYDEGIRFPICNTTNLENAMVQAGLINIATTNLDAFTIFRNFDDYWNPFLGGQGPAPGYLASLPEDAQTEVKNILQKKLPVEPDGSIKLLARAIGVRGSW